MKRAASNAWCTRSSAAPSRQSTGLSAAVACRITMSGALMASRCSCGRLHLAVARRFFFQPLEVLARHALVGLRCPDEEDAALEREQQLLDPETDVPDQ